MDSNRHSTNLRCFFAGVAEQTFQVQLGVADPPMVDYITDLLMRFVRSDAQNRLRADDGRPVNNVGQMLVEADSRIGDARREVHRHIGDYTLFWAGLYPESLRRKRGADAADRFVDYCQHGKRAYLIASTIETESEENAPAQLLERLGHQFEMCAYGLREVRREWERRDEDAPPSPFLIN